MKTEESKVLTESMKALSQDYASTARLVGNSAANSSSDAKKLWKTGNKSLLVKAGLALIVFPEPVVSDVLGTSLLLAGAVQEGIKRRSVYLDDLPKAFKNVMQDLKSARNLI